MKKVVVVEIEICGDVQARAVCAALEVCGLQVGE